MLWRQYKVMNLDWSYYHMFSGGGSKLTKCHHKKKHVSLSQLKDRLQVKKGLLVNSWQKERLQGEAFAQPFFPSPRAQSWNDWGMFQPTHLAWSARPGGLRFKAPSPPLPSLFLHPTCLWYSLIKAASNMWTRSTLSDFAKIHIVVNPLSLYMSKRDTGSAVTPILKIHNLMPIFSRKQMALDLQWDKIFPAVGLETVFIEWS